MLGDGRKDEVEMIRRSNVSLSRGTALYADRSILARGNKLVYVLLADKKIRYREGRSRIVYIGTTRNGSSRIAASVAWRAEEILRWPGVLSLDARALTCRPRQNVKTWLILEKALLIAFREHFGEVPRCNIHGKGIRATHHFSYFSRQRLVDIIEDLS